MLIKNVCKQGIRLQFAWLTDIVNYKEEIEDTEERIEIQSKTNKIMTENKLFKRTVYKTLL